MLGSSSHSLRRPLVALLVFALLVAMAAAVGQPAPASAADPASGPVRVGPSTGSYYNPVAPQLERTGDEREQLGRLDRAAGKASLAPSAKVLAQADAFDRKHSAGNPPAAEVRGRSRPGRPRPARARGSTSRPPAPRRPGC